MSQTVAGTLVDVLEKVGVSQIFGLIGAVAFAAANQVAAQDYPFCIQGEEFGGGSGDCIFWSYQQCQAAASGLLGYCRINPWRRLNQVGPGVSSVTSKKCMANRPGCWARLLRMASQR